MTLEEAVRPGNIKIVECLVKNKTDAARAMCFAIKIAINKIADHLFERWDFSREDFARVRRDDEYMFDELSYLLSNYDASCHILEKFFPTTWLM